MLLPFPPFAFALATTGQRRASLLRWFAALSKDQSSTASDLDSKFDQWLHLNLINFDVPMMGILSMYWWIQAWMTVFHPTELMVAVFTSVLFTFRWAQVTNHAGQAWCACLIICHFVESGSVAFGEPDRVARIVSLRLAHREGAIGICLIIGLMHGTQPISVRLRLWTGVLFELCFLLWMLPILFRTDHPCRLPSGELYQGYVLLVIGCVVSFALGMGTAQVFVQSVLRPLWTAGQVQEQDHQQLAAEKDRLCGETGGM